MKRDEKLRREFLYNWREELVTKYHFDRLSLKVAEFRRNKDTLLQKLVMLHARKVLKKEKKWLLKVKE